MTMTLRVDPLAPAPGTISRAAAVIRSGGLVAFPTETVYGLGANALDAAAVARIFEVKGRPPTNPVIVHIAGPGDALNVAEAWPETAARLAERFWPGPLTLVVPRRPTVPAIVTAGGPTVAVRCPSHPVARALIRAAAVPIAAPSANRSTELSPTCAEHVLRGLNTGVDLLLDGGPCSGGIESTVVDVSGDHARVLRPGLITATMLEAVVGPIACGPAAEAIARSPGQMARHYSPRTPVRLCSQEDHQRHWEDLCRTFHRVGMVRFDGPGLEGAGPGDGARSAAGGTVLVRLPADPVDAAAGLYAALHSLDQCCLDAVLIVLPPDTPDWAGARDRLTRAGGNESQ